MPRTYESESDRARALLMPRPSPAMIPERIGIIGSMQGVNASSTPKTRKLASTSAALPSKRCATSMSLANSEKRGARRSERDARRRIHRDVAYADVGATLRGHFQVEAAAALRRDPHPQIVAIGLHLAEEVVLVLVAGRELRSAELRALRREAKALAVHVVAVRDREMHFYGIRVERARRETERLLRLEQVVGRAAELELPERRGAEQDRHDEQEDFFHALFTPWS